MQSYYRQQLLTQLSQKATVTLQFWPEANQTVESVKLREEAPKL